MGMSASAHLFYGIVLDPEAAQKLLKKFQKELKEAEDEEYDEEDEADAYLFDKLEALAAMMGFDAVYLGSEGYEREDVRYGIACWEATWYSFDGVQRLRMPKPEKLDKDWAKIATALKLGRKKPGWHTFTEWS